MQQSEIEFYGTIAEGFEQRIRPFLNDLEDKIKDSSYQDQGSDKTHVEFIKGFMDFIDQFFNNHQFIRYHIRQNDGRYTREWYEETYLFTIQGEDTYSPEKILVSSRNFPEPIAYTVEHGETKSNVNEYFFEDGTPLLKEITKFLYDIERGHYRTSDLKHPCISSMTYWISINTTDGIRKFILHLQDSWIGSKKSSMKVLSKNNTSSMMTDTTLTSISSLMLKITSCCTRYLA